jgi:hypothetical protein
VVDLGPGDTLLVPAYWFAHTQLMAGPGGANSTGDGGGGGGGGDGGTGCSAALLLRLQPAAAGAQGAATAAEWGPGGPRLLPDGALQLQCSRMVEAVVGAEAGAANVRVWLRRLAEGREWRHIDLGTPEGYKHLRMCELVLEQVGARGWWDGRESLGAGAAGRCGASISREG